MIFLIQLRATISDILLYNRWNVHLCSFQRINGSNGLGRCLHYSTIKFGFISFHIHLHFFFSFCFFIFTWNNTYKTSVILLMCAGYVIRCRPQQQHEQYRKNVTSILNYKYNNLRKTNVNIHNTKTCPARLIQCVFHGIHMRAIKFI